MSDPLYTNRFSFLGLPWYRDCPEADVVISGVPFDMATSGRAGARFGPTAIRAVSGNLAWEQPRWPWDFHFADRIKAADAGDVEFRYGEPQSLVEALQAHAGKLLDAGKTLLTFGGDHFIALPLIREHVRVHGPLALIHFDAHTDTDSHGTAYDHGAMFHHAHEDGLLLAEHSVQIGIRTSYTVDGHPYHVLNAAEVNDTPADKLLERIHDIVGDKPAYVSFDIDGIDPAHAPGTGTPVAGGMTTDKALKLVRGLQGLDLKGMDLVEVSPPYDHAELTALAAATLALEFLQVLASG